MMNNEEQQVIGLAATVQALSNVHEIASNGQFDEYRAIPIFQSLVSYSPENALAAYGNDIGQLSHGLSQLKKLFGDHLNRDIAQYLLAVIAIELKLVRSPQMRNVLQTELRGIANTLTHIDSVATAQAVFEEDFEETGDESISENFSHADEDEVFSINFHENLVAPETIAQFAEIYKQTASQTEPRIMIKGNHEHLQNEQSANKIRALLLGALRGAAFFRHYGGKRVDFMLRRSQYIDIINHLSR